MVKGVASDIQSVRMLQGGFRIIATLQSQRFARLVSADLAFIHSDATGKLISRFTNDVQFLRDAVVRTFTNIARDLLVVIVLVGVMFSTDWRMSLIAVVAFPLAVVPIIRIGRRLRRVSSHPQPTTGAPNGK